MTIRRTPQVVEVAMDDIQNALEEAARSLPRKDYEALKTLALAYQQLTGLVEDRQMTIQQLRKLLFGSTSEKTEKVLGSLGGNEGAADLDPQTTRSRVGDAAGGTPSTKAKGHGRNGEEAYVGAERFTVPHESLRVKDSCPDCRKGKIYPMEEPQFFIRVVGQAPLQARIWECERLRCSLCGSLFNAHPPEGIGEEKYDASSASMIGLLRYGSGFPFHRLQKLQGNFGIPLPVSTQWEIVATAASKLEPAYLELIHQAAQGEVLYNDDTPGKILEILGQRRSLEGDPANKDERTGIFTTGIISLVKGRKVALFFTGPQHAGENLTDVLRQRAAVIGPPIQMCDALSRNLPKDFKVILANCNAHARRKFVNVATRFPAECRFVLETLAEVYRIDAEARKLCLSKQERLELHKAHSGPVMEKLKAWIAEQIDGHKVEENSGLGDALTYLRDHWMKLTLFLREPGAPLDNNICERVLKKSIIHRKNSLFYKTQNGARVGDLYMSLIQTAELCGANPFDYLTKVQQHEHEVRENPAAWLPWNYQATLAASRKPP